MGETGQQLIPYQPLTGFTKIVPLFLRSLRKVAVFLNEFAKSDMARIHDAPCHDIIERSSQPWYQFVGEIDWLLIDADYIWAASLLTAIRDTVLQSRRVSDAQRRTVDTIRARTAGVQ